MPHSLHNTKFNFRPRSKQVSTAVSTSSSASKKPLCVLKWRANCNLRSGFAPPKTHLDENALALTHSKRSAGSQAKGLREELAIPQMSGKNEYLGIVSQIAVRRGLLLGIRCRLPVQTLAFAHAFQAVGFKPLDPAWHGAPMRAEQVGYLLKSLAARYQQQTVQPLVAARLIVASDFLLDSGSHHFRIGKFQFAHGGAPASGIVMSMDR